ncbi:MAG TPA: dienelactone hydrolase family protein [Candidatus Binatia bacterium]|jgi:carboxymethylenebutenolidase|nr:dienelactone hydrolase family protein [Candidatus Binatia bacterium]
MPSSWEKVKVGDSTMRLYMSARENQRPAGAVVVVQGQTGVDDFLKFSDMVAREGFVAAAPDLYHRDAPDCKDDAPTRRMRLRDATVIQDINATVNFLKSHPSVNSGRIGIVGFCMGGRVVYLMSAVNPDIKAGVMYYGSDPFSAWGEGASPFERTNDIHCPIMGHFGEDDKNPSPADMKKLDAELTRLGKPHEFHSYPNAAHAFANFGSSNYREHAASDSWPRTFGFFAKHLKSK